MAQTSHDQPILLVADATPSALGRGMMSLVGVVSSTLVPVSRSFVLTAGLLLALVSPHASAAAPASAPGEVAAPTTAEPSGPLRVTVAAAIGDGNLIPGWVVERNPGLAEKVPTRDGLEQWIDVEISGETYDYRIRVKAMRNGAEVEPAAELVACECNNEKLLELVDAGIAGAVAKLEANEVKEPDATESTEGDVASGTTPSGSGTTTEGERRRISGLGIGGIVAASIGVAAVAGGGTMMALEPQSISTGSSLLRNWWLPGVVTLSTGGAVLAAGLSMVIVDVIQCGKADAPPRCERRNKKPRLQLGPLLEARGGGVVISGRF